MNTNGETRTKRDRVLDAARELSEQAGGGFLKPQVIAHRAGMTVAVTVAVLTDTIKHHPRLLRTKGHGKGRAWKFASRKDPLAVTIEEQQQHRDDMRDKAADSGESGRSDDKSGGGEVSEKKRPRTGEQGWTIAEAAELTGVPKQTLYGLAASGRIKAAKVDRASGKGKQKWRLDPDSLDAYVALRSSRSSGVPDAAPSVRDLCDPAYTLPLKDDGTKRRLNDVAPLAADTTEGKMARDLEALHRIVDGHAKRMDAIAGDVADINAAAGDDGNDVRIRRIEHALAKFAEFILTEGPVTRAALAKALLAIDAGGE